MSRIPRAVLVVAAVALIAGAVGAVTVAGGPVASGQSATSSTATDNGTNETRAGERLAGLAGVQGVEVQGSVDLAAYDVRLERAGSAERRADVVAAQLVVTDRHLAALSRRADALDRARENGSTTDGKYVARAAEIDAAVANVRAVLARSRRALDGLPESRRADLADRIRSQRERATVLESRTGDAGDAVAGSGAVGAAPITTEDVAAAVEAGGSRAPGSLRGLFGSERITVHVRQADGDVNQYHLRTSDGHVVESGPGPAADPTLHLYTRHETVREIRDADDPWGVTDRAFAEDRITYRGDGVVGGAKYGLLSLVQDAYEVVRGILSWTGLA